MSSTFPCKVPCCFERVKKSTPRLQTHAHISIYGYIFWLIIQAHSHRRGTTLEKHKTTNSLLDFSFQSVTVCTCLREHACRCQFFTHGSVCVSMNHAKMTHTTRVHLRPINRIHARTHTSLSFISTRPQIYSEPMSRVLPPGFGNDCQSGSP